MDYSLSSLQNFQFAEPFWLWGIVLLPVVLVLYALLYRQGGNKGAKLSEFADPHLLPHLMGDGEGNVGKEKRRAWLSLLMWSLLWVFGLLAMAGPRWDYTEVKAFAPARNLVILLDLSRSMDVQDIKPSRLARARQEIADINRLVEGMNIGLIAFASVPHVITPLTDERETLARFLPLLKTDLVYTQGSNLSLALQRAGEMLAAELGREKHILVVSDGGFQDGDATIFKMEKELLKQSIRVHVMGMGTAQGAPVPDGKGGYAKENGKAVISNLEKSDLQRIAQDGKGLYLNANYLSNDTNALLSQVNAQTQSEAQKTTRFWEERFYLFLAPFVFLFLPWFRRNAVFPALVILMLQPSSAHAMDWRDLFLNKEQQGKAAVEQQNYEDAVQKFDDSYRRGVAQYKAGQYQQAAQSFTQSDRADIETDAEYNLGNAQLMGGKIEDAIASYEGVLKDHSDHADAAHNLELAKKMLQQQQQDQSQQQQNSDEQKQDSGQQGDKDQQSQQQGQKQDSSQQQEESDQSQEGEKSDQQKESSQQDQESQQEQKQADNEEQQAGDQQKEKQHKSGEESKEQQPQDAEDSENQDTNQNSQQVQKTQKDIDADQWLNRIKNEPEQFLKNKFYIESKRQGAQEGNNPW